MKIFRGGKHVPAPMIQKIAARPLTRKQFYALGGFANPQLFTRQRTNGSRRYYMS